MGLPALGWLCFTASAGFAAAQGHDLESQGTSRTTGMPVASASAREKFRVYCPGAAPQPTPDARQMMRHQPDSFTVTTTVHSARRRRA
jgi:hypothetical protein